MTEIVSRYLKELILPYVYAEARALLSEHRGAGQDVVIVSTSGQEVVAPIAALLGAHSVIATRMRIADGRYTGETECYAYGEKKAVQVRLLAAARGYSLPGCYAYSDSVTDLPLLEAVGHPRVVHADRALRRIAAVRGWPGSRSAPCERRAQPLGNRSAVINQDHQLVPHSIYAARPIRRRKVLRTYGPGTATGHPRATSRGRRARAAGHSVLAPASGARRGGPPGTVNVRLVTRA